MLPETVNARFRRRRARQEESAICRSLSKERPLMIVQRETPDSPEVVAFLAAADQRSAALYPEESRHGLSLPTLYQLALAFLWLGRVAKRLGVVATC